MQGGGDDSPRARWTARLAPPPQSLLQRAAATACRSSSMLPAHYMAFSQHRVSAQPYMVKACQACLL